MTRAFDVRNAAAWFRLIAFAEALSWIGLLTGMYFKYLGTRVPGRRQIFGPVHGGVFIAFLVAAVLTGMALKWGPARGCWRCWAASCRWAV